MEPGKYEITWNGRDEGGNEVASGVYFCRLETPERVRTRRMIRLK
jgi:hypothetical protein